MEKILYDKLNKRESEIQWFIDQDGNYWIDKDPNGVQMNGNLTIRILKKDDKQYEIRGESLFDFLDKEKKIKLNYPIGGFAPGHYINKCANCEDKFMGDKYARQCESCAINYINESNTKALSELSKLKKALKDIKFSNDEINEIIK